jgi:hypothetical protein
MMMMIYYTFTCSTQQPLASWRILHGYETTKAQTWGTNRNKQIRKEENQFMLSKRKHYLLYKKKNLHGLSPRANYTDRATATCRRSDCQLLRIGYHVVSVTDPYCRILGFLDRIRYFSIK